MVFYYDRLQAPSPSLERPKYPQRSINYASGDFALSALSKKLSLDLITKTIIGQHPGVASRRLSLNVHKVAKSMVFEVVLIPLWFGPGYLRGGFCSRREDGRIAWKKVLFLITRRRYSAQMRRKAIRKGKNPLWQRPMMN